MYLASVLNDVSVVLTDVLAGALADALDDALADVLADLLADVYILLRKKSDNASNKIRECIDLSGVQVSRCLADV